MISNSSRLVFLGGLLITLAACGSGSGSSSDSSDNQGNPIPGLASCEAQSSGAICGTLFAPDGATPLAQAEITASNGSGSASLVGLGGSRGLVANAAACVSDATGAFACACADAGTNVTFYVNSALVDFSFTASCVADSVTNVPAASTTPTASESGRVAVITGTFDKVEVVLADLFDCGDVSAGELDYGTECSRLHIFNGGARVFDGIDTDPNNGDGNYRTAEDLLTDPQLMDDYDLILFNCGLSETLADDPEVVANLQDYIADGGRIYGSDWAYRYIEEAFPDKINFYGSTGINGLSATPEDDEARDGGTGVETVTVADSGLLTYLRENDIIDDAATTADIDFDLGGWAVMSDADDDVTRLLTSAGLADPSDAVLAGESELPIAVLSCDDATGGVFYASYHTEIGSATDADDAQEAILRYMILNGFNACL